MSGLSAADVRRIVREEVRSALSEVAFHLGEREPQFLVTFDPRCTGGVFCPVSGHVEYRGDGRGGFQAVHISP